MDFHILGPLEVRRDGEPLPLGAKKQRMLLAVLLLHANRVVSKERLIEDLWGARPPKTAPNALQVHVAQLRKSLDPGRAKGAPSEVLSTHFGGYLLQVDADRLDSDRFERLEELRIAALEERIDAELALGRHAAVVGELDALAREHPLRERLRAQLMLALYRSGRQAEALEVYRDARRT